MDYSKTHLWNLLDILYINKYVINIYLTEVQKIKEQICAFTTVSFISGKMPINSRALCVEHTSGSKSFIFIGPKTC